MRIKYQNSSTPGCGGCILLVLLTVLLLGGFSGLMKFIGTLFYGVIFTIFLGLGGFWFFSWWLQKKVAEYEQSQTENHNRFVWLLVHIIINIAKTDGKISKEEIQTLHSFFRFQLGYNQTQMGWVKELIKEAIHSTNELDPMLYEFRDSFPSEHRFILLELVYQILFTKKEISEEELLTARYIAQILEISSYEQQTLESKYRYYQQHSSGFRGRNGRFGGFGNFGGYNKRESYSNGNNYRNGDEAAKHYATLGLQKGATKTEIKKAYRALSMQYHPDKVRNIGEEFQKMAEEKMKEINVAYDYFEHL